MSLEKSPIAGNVRAAGTLKQQIEQIIYGYIGEPNNERIRVKLSDELYRVMLQHGADTLIDGFSSTVFPNGEARVTFYSKGHHYDLNMKLDQVLTGIKSQSEVPVNLPPTYPTVTSGPRVRYTEPEVKSAPAFVPEEDPAVAYDRAMGVVQRSFKC